MKNAPENYKGQKKKGKGKIKTIRKKKENREEKKRKRKQDKKEKKTKPELFLPLLRTLAFASGYCSFNDSRINTESESDRECASLGNKM